MVDINPDAVRRPLQRARSERFAAVHTTGTIAHQNALQTRRRTFSAAANLNVRSDGRHRSSRRSAARRAGAATRPAMRPEPIGRGQGTHPSFHGPCRSSVCRSYAPQQHAKTPADSMPSDRCCRGRLRALLKRVWVGAAPISGSARGAGGAGGLGIERSWCSPDPAADGRTSGGSGRSGVAPGRPACQRATRVLRCAAALRVTHRPSRRSDSSYGPCGPAWTGASRPSTTTRPARRPAVGDRCRLIGPTATPGPGAGPGTPVGRGAGAACVVSFCRSGCKRRGFLVS